ncbi:asparagine-rich protein, putative [Plasmodium yoelii yoelii]|nr:asparagine-rich protein, putative [Plasmodium yoelii yoelii]
MNDPNLKNMYALDEYKNGNFQIMSNLDHIEKRDFDINNVMLKGDTHGDGKVGSNNNSDETANNINNNSLENRDNASNMKGNKLSIYNLLVNAFNGGKKNTKSSGKEKRNNPTTVLGDESGINASSANNTSLNSNIDLRESINKDNKYIDHQSSMNMRNSENSDTLDISNNNASLLSHLKSGSGMDNSSISTHNIREGNMKGVNSKSGNNVTNSGNKMNKIEMMNSGKLGNENQRNKSNSPSHSHDSRNNSSLIMNHVNNKKYNIHKNDIDGKLSIDMLNNSEMELNNLLGTLPKNLNDNLSLYLENKRNNSSGMLPNESGISHFNQKFGKLEDDDNNNNNNSNGGQVVMINKEEHQRFVSLKSMLDTYRADVLNTCLLLEELILNQAMCKYIPTELYNKILKCYERLDMMLTDINNSNGDMGMKRTKDLNSLRSIGNLETMDYMNLNNMNINNVNLNDMDIKMDENMLYEDFKSYWDMAFSKNKIASQLSTKDLINNNQKNVLNPSQHQDFHINDVNNSNNNVLNKNGTINNKNNIHINQLFYDQGHGNKISNNNNHPIGNGGLNSSIKSSIGIMNTSRGSTNMIGNNNISLSEMSNNNNLGNSQMKSQKKKDSSNIMDTIISDNMNNSIGGCIGNSKSKKNSNDNMNDENNNHLNENMVLNYNNLKNSSIMNKKKFISNMNNNGGNNIDLVNFINSANNTIMKGNGMIGNNAAINSSILNGNNNVNMMNAKNSNTNYPADINSKLAKELNNYNSMNKERNMNHIEESDIKAVNKLLMLNNNNFPNLKVNNNNNDNILSDYSTNNATNNIMLNAETFFKKLNLYNDDHNNNVNNKNEGIGCDSNLLSLININRNSKSSYNVNQKGDNTNLQACNSHSEYDNEPRDNNNFKKQLNNENHLYNMQNKNMRNDINLKYLEEINSQFNFLPRNIRKENTEHNLMNILNFQNNLENKMQKQID